MKPNNVYPYYRTAFQPISNCLVFIEHSNGIVKMEVPVLKK